MGSSKKQTVGYKYFLGMHQILVHGPVDFMSRYTVDERVAWSGISTGGTITVFAESLFGGDDREGGVSGIMDLEMGYPDQGPNGYLQSQLGSAIPGFRGVVGIVQRQMYLGNNPYLKKNGFRLQRIHVRQDGIDQWYDATAEVPVQSGTATAINPGDTWEYQILSEHANPGYNNLTVPTSGWSSGAAPFGHSTSGAGPYATDWPLMTVLWVKRTITIPGGYSLRLDIDVENGCVVLINGGVRAWVNRDNTQPPPSYTGFVVIGPFTSQTTVELAIKAYDEIGFASTDTWLKVFGTYTAGVDMNPSHIIRECLTDPNWGMGYNEADIDDESFETAADQLYDENMGISILWDRQMPIEQFIQEIIKHINGTLYVARRGPQAGKFVLKLIRADYNEEDLLHFDESNIDKMENFKRIEEGELTNSVTVNYWDSATGKTASTTAQDPALVQQQGAVINTTMQYVGFTNAALANRVALRDLTTLSNPLASCTIYTGMDAKDLNIGDVIAVSWEDYGLIRLPMRITGMSLGDGKSNAIKMNLSQDAFALPQQGVIIPPDVGWTDPSQEPVAMSREYAEELPYYELAQQLTQATLDNQLNTEPDLGVVGASGSKPQSGAINARIMTDSGAGYQDVGALDFCPSALLDGAVGRGDGSPTETWTVKSGVDLLSVDAETYARVSSSAGVEYVYIVSILLLEIEVKRGVLDTVPLPHEDGALIMFSDPFVQADPTEYVTSDEIDVKLLTVAGQGVLPLTAAAVHPVTMGSRAIRPYPAAQWTLDGDYWPATLVGVITNAWVDRNRVQQTSPSLVGWYDGSVTSEAGVTYNLRLKNNLGVQIDEVVGVTSPTDYSPPSSGTYTLQLVSIRDSYENFVPLEHTFSYLAALPDDIMAQNILAKMEHWWPLNETAGPYFKDVHGGMDLRWFGTGTGVTFSSPTLRTGGATCVQFISSGGAFQWGNPEWWIKNVNVSLIAWTKVLDATYTVNRPIICDSPATDASEAINQRLQWWHGVSTATPNPNTMGTFWEYGVGTNYTAPQSNTALDTNAHMHAVTRDSTFNTVSYNRDGVADGGGVYTNAPTGGDSIDSRFSLGNVPANNPASGTSNGNSVRAAMQDVSAYRVPLNDDEINWLYNGGAGRNYADIWTLSTLPHYWTPAQLKNKVVWLKSDHIDNSESVAGYVNRIANLTGFPAGTPFSGSVTNQFRNDISTLNGRKVLTGNGTTNCLGHFAFPNTRYRWQGVNGSTFISVSRPVTTPSVGQIAMGQTRDGGSNGHLHSLYRNNTGTVSNGGRRLTGDSYTSYSDAATHLSWDIIGAYNDYTTGNSNLKYNGNAATGSVVYSTGVTSSVAKGNDFGLGGMPYGTVDASRNLEVAEVIVLDGLLTATEWEKLEGYLAHEWGLTANLPGGHPYKSTRPLV